MGTSARRDRSVRGSARAVVLLLLAILIFGAGVAATYLYMTGRLPVDLPFLAKASPAPSPSPEPVPTPVAEATPVATPAPEVSPEPSPATVADAAPPAPAGPRPPGGRRTRPAPAAAGEAGKLVNQAETAVTEKKYTEATQLYDRALQIDPTNPQARAGRARVQALASGRKFVLGYTASESLKSVQRDLKGFEADSVGVKRAPQVDGEVDLEVEPKMLLAGQPYAVKVFLKNRGRKPIKVDELKISMIVDGRWSTRPLPSKTKEVQPNQRGLLEELPGIWKDNIKTWAVEVVVTSSGQDVYKNRLSWQ